MNDADYEPAVAIIREHLNATPPNADQEVTCRSCGETSPGHFDSCWSCGNAISDPETPVA